MQFSIAPFLFSILLLAINSFAQVFSTAPSAAISNTVTGGTTMGVLPGSTVSPITGSSVSSYGSQIATTTTSTTSITTTASATTTSIAGTTTAPSTTQQVAAAAGNGELEAAVIGVGIVGFIMGML